MAAFEALQIRRRRKTNLEYLSFMECLGSEVKPLNCRLMSTIGIWYGDLKKKDSGNGLSVELLYCCS